MPGFSTLNTAISGLNAAQRAIDATAQNIANANTVGYSRQQVRLSSVGPTTAADFHTSGNAAILGGVKVEDVIRVRDTFLEAARVSAGAGKAALDIRASTLAGAEQLLNEPGENGIQAVLDDFYSSWQDLSQSPGTDAGALGGQVLQKASAVATQLQFVASGIQQRWETANGDLETTLTQLNQAASDLALINQKISEGKVAGRPVNELLDRRDTLVRTIGELAGGRASESAMGTVDVTINGISLVAGNRAETFTLTGSRNLGNAVADPPRIMLGDLQVPVSSGRVAGLLQSLGNDLPTLASQLDGVAVALRDSVNIVHGGGYTLDGEAGGDFFAGTSAFDLTVVPTSGTQLAISGSPGVVDGSNALAIADLALDDKAAAVLGGAGASEQIRSLVSQIGTKLQGLNRTAEVQEAVLGAADAAVESDAGVSIDEEMTSLLQYQRSYQASARVISAIDEMLDTLINRTAV